MVDSNVALSSTNRDRAGASLEGASQNVSFLQTQAESWLAVLFNIFGNVAQDGRGMVGEVISSWVAIASNEVCG